MARARKPSPVVPDLADFRRASWGLGALNLGQVGYLAALGVEGVGPNTRPDLIPLQVLELMGWDPVIALGEAAATCAVRDPEVYFVRHPDPAVAAEVEAWLWPLLPATLAVLARSVAYGAVPYVLDWTVEDLRVTVARPDVAPATLDLPDHVHYGLVHEIFPSEVRLLLDPDDNERLRALAYGGREYGTDRAFVSVWGRQFGWWLGQGSRRRVWRPYYAGEFTQLWYARWTERSIDPPRLGFAPRGVITVDGVEVASTELLARALTALRGGGSTGLPSERQDGQPLWDVRALELPDRSDAWNKALDRYDALKLLGSMVPPSSVGLEEATFAGARIPAQMFVELVQSIATYCAQELTRIVAVVERVRGRGAPTPEVVARRLPQARAKLLLDVFRAVAPLPRAVEGGREVTLGELVSEDLLDELGITRRPTEAAAREPKGAVAGPGIQRDETGYFVPGPGRPPEATSAREERRESAREPEGMES